MDMLHYLYISFFTQGLNNISKNIKFEFYSMKSKNKIFSGEYSGEYLVTNLETFEEGFKLD